jgi:hypothetical protein
MADKLCPQCNAVLQVCANDDFQGRHWYWCELEDCYWHETDLEDVSRQKREDEQLLDDRLQQIADANDERETAQSIRASLYSA